MQDASSSPIVTEAIERLRALYGERLRGVAVRMPAPGPTPEDDADMELIAVLDHISNRWAEIHEMSAVASELGLAHTLLVLPTPVTEAEFTHPQDVGGLLRFSLIEAVRVA